MVGNNEVESWMVMMSFAAVFEVFITDAAAEKGSGLLSWFIKLPDSINGGDNYSSLIF